MKEIKFNKDYYKLYALSSWRRNEHPHIADLIQVFVVDKLYLSKGFIKYDTSEIDSDEYNTIDDGKYLLLIFQEFATPVIFTTLRKLNKENIELYSNSIGETFKIVREKNEKK